MSPAMRNTLAMAYQCLRLARAALVNGEGPICKAWLAEAAWWYERTHEVST